jgi:hypothetical protein
MAPQAPSSTTTSPTTGSTQAEAQPATPSNVRGQPGDLSCTEEGSSRRPQLAMGEPECVSWFGVAFPIWREQRVLLVVILAAALGALIHCLRSVSWYVGNRDLRMSWIPHYLLLPYVGAGIGFVFYVVIRGGFFSAGSEYSDTNPYAFAALAALMGMFSTEAVLKLQQVAQTILAPKERGKDDVPPTSGGVDAERGAAGAAAAGEEAASGEAPLGHPVPVIGRIEPQTVIAGSTATTVTITGWNFVKGATVRVDTTDRVPTTVSPTSLSFEVAAEELTAPRTIKVHVVNPMPGGGMSKPRTLTVAPPSAPSGP